MAFIVWCELNIRTGLGIRYLSTCAGDAPGDALAPHSAFGPGLAGSLNGGDPSNRNSHALGIQAIASTSSQAIFTEGM